MSTALVLGNGNMLTNLDERLQMSDLYWPHVGKNNHLMGHHIRTYVWDYGNLVSFEDESFKVTASYVKDSLTGNSVIESEKLGVKISLENTVLPHKDIYIAQFTVTNLWDMHRDLKLFINHDFYIKEHNVGDTACWYPMQKMLFHYKDNVFLGMGSTGEIAQYSCDQSHSNEGAGTLPDPRTGLLNSYPIYRGAVESTIGFDLSLDGGATKTLDYFIVCGENMEQCIEYAKYVREEGMKDLLSDVTSFWKSYITSPHLKINEKDSALEKIFVNKDLKEKAKDIFTKSIGIIRTQADNNGAIIAANDSAHLKYLKDTYSYIWNRDASLVASAMDDVGFSSLSEKYFQFAANILEPNGYFFHTYTPTGNLGTSWHPWIDPSGNPQLPIQEDGTATTLWALWKSYENNHNQELISDLWEPFIKPAAEFLCKFRYSDGSKDSILKELSESRVAVDTFEENLNNTGLPMASFDLWEERKGVYTYTCAAVYGGLLGASILALKLGQHMEAERYSQVAFEVKKCTIDLLYDKENERFIHGLLEDYENKKCIKSLRPDASISRIWFFEMLPCDDERLVKTMDWLEKELWNPYEVGGILRYPNDDYYRQDKTHMGNPWYLTTLWFAQYYLKKNEVEKSLKYLNWVINNTKGTYLLSEQIDCKTGTDISVKPLSWSHGEYIRTFKMLLDTIKI